jgi:hypothetical protein
MWTRLFMAHVIAPQLPSSRLFKPCCDGSSCRLPVSKQTGAEAGSVVFSAQAHETPFPGKEHSRVCFLRDGFADKLSARMAAGEGFNVVGIESDMGAMTVQR